MGILYGRRNNCFINQHFFSLAKNTEPEAKKQFIRDAIVFGAIGILVLVLSVMYYIMCLQLEGNIILNFIKWSYYILFIVYAVLALLGHSKQSYIINKLCYSNCLCPFEED